MAFSELVRAKIDIEMLQDTTTVHTHVSRDTACIPLIRYFNVLGQIVFLGVGLSSATAFASVRENQEVAMKGMLPEEQIRWLINKLRRKAGECGGGSSADSSESGKDPSAAPNNTDNHRVAIRFTQADGTVVTLDCDFGK